jgi:hypothetical protein
MARLIIEARATGAEGPLAQAAVAAVGNSCPLYVVVSVSDTDGLAVAGLTAANFTISAIIVAAGGAEVEITSVADFEQGDYEIDVVPVIDIDLGTRASWTLGRYIFFLVVTHGGDRGQTLCDVFVH